MINPPLLLFFGLNLSITYQNKIKDFLFIMHPDLLTKLNNLKLYYIKITNL